MKFDHMFFISVMYIFIGIALVLMFMDKPQSWSYVVLGVAVASGLIGTVMQKVAKKKPQNEESNKK